MTEAPVFPEELRNDYADATEYVAASWEPIDLSGHVNGTFKALQPSIMERSDGKHLLYRGMVHSFQGESESGKSMVAQAETARQIQAGTRCAYIDFESDPATLTNRLLQLGASPTDIVTNLDYIRPDIDPRSLPEESAAWDHMLRQRYGLAVIDGVTEAFAVYGIKSIDNDEVTAWGRMVPRQLAAKTGAAVVVIDHVTKSTEGRGRFAIGAQAKMSYLTGAAYTVEILSPIGVGMLGRIALRVGKDRPGQVRPISGEWRKADRTQETAVVTIDSTRPGKILYSLDAHRKTLTPEDLISDLKERISKALEDADKALTSNEVTKLVSGNRATLLEALADLEASGNVSVAPGQRNSRNYSSIKPYRRGNQ